MNVKAPLQQTGPIIFRAPCENDAFMAGALQALQAGIANEHQQKSALAWIIESASAVDVQPFIPGDPHSTSFMGGRMFVGQTIRRYLRASTRDLAIAQQKKETDK